MYGDASLWYLIADANGLSGSGLTEGMRINVLNVNSNIHNNVNVYKPYNSSQIIGDTSPTMPGIKQKQSWWKKLVSIVMVVIAVVVAIYVPQLIPALTTYLGAAGAAAVGAMVGSIASQTFGIITGVQDSINWKSVAVSGLTAGLTAGVKIDAFGSFQTANQIATAAINNAIGQGVNIAVGLQEKFDWRAMAASAIAAPVAKMATDKINKHFDWTPNAQGFVSNNMTANFVNGMARSAATQIINMAVYKNGKFDGVQLLGDAFGNMFAASAHEVVQERLKEQAAQKAMYSLANGASREQTRLRVPDRPQTSQDNPAIANGSGFTPLSEIDDIELSQRINAQLDHAPRFAGVADPNEISDVASLMDMTYSSARSMKFSTSNQGGLSISRGAPSDADAQLEEQISAAQAAEYEKTLAAEEATRSWHMEERDEGGILPNVLKYGVGGVEVFLGGIQNGAVRIGSGLASIPYLADSVSAAEHIQQDSQQRFGYELRSEGAREIASLIGGGVQYVNDNALTPLRNNMEDHIGLGATATVFGGVQFGVEAASVIFGGGAVSSALKSRFSSAGMSVDDFAASGARSTLEWAAPRMENYLSSKGFLLYAVPADNITITSIGVSGKRAIDLGKSYEMEIRRLYGDVSFTERQYEAFINGKIEHGIADNVVTIGGKSVAIEAKYVDDWSNSLRNPESKNGTKPWAVVEQQKVLNQAQKYGSAFDYVLYHTNSDDFATYYSKIFNDAGVNNFKFVITPAIKNKGD